MAISEKVSDADSVDPYTLTANILKGSPQAETQFVRQFTPGLLVMLRARCDDDGMVEDLCHETLIVVLKRLRTRPLDDPERIAGYVVGVAKRLLLGEVRKAIRQNTQIDADAIARVLSDEQEAWASAYQLELRRYLECCIEKLNIERDQELLRRFYSNEEDKSRLAQDLDISPKRFDTILYRARTRLMQLIRKDLGTSNDESIKELIVD